METPEATSAPIPVDRARWGVAITATGAAIAAGTAAVAVSATPLLAFITLNHNETVVGSPALWRGDPTCGPVVRCPAW